MKSKNLYDIFGILPQATHEEIMIVFWKLVKKYHHDHGHAEYIIKDILRIKQILTSVKKRQAYNQFLQWQKKNNTRMIPPCYQMKIYRNI